MPKQSHTSFFALAVAFAASCCLLAAAPATAAEPVGITAIDTRAGIVTARDATGRLTIRFTVKDAALLRSLKVGQTVQADVGTQQVTIHGGAVCCAIVSVQSAAPAASQPGVTGQAMQNAGGDPLGAGAPPRRIGKGQDYPNCSTCGEACKACADRNMACNCTQVGSGSSPGPEDDTWSCTCSGAEPRLPRGR
jgi:Cu/Ag efflux protein CusF